MSNGNICTVGQLIKLLRAFPNKYVIRADETEITIKNEENKTVAFINSNYVKIFEKE